MKNQTSSSVAADAMNSKETWTAGPWIAEQVYDGGRTICSMRSTDRLMCVNAAADGLRPYDATDGNARLIAAAPALYEVANEALRYIGLEPVLDDDGIAVIKQLRAALALVDGPQTELAQ